MLTWPIMSFAVDPAGGKSPNSPYGLKVTFVAHKIVERF